MTSFTPPGSGKPSTWPTSPSRRDWIGRAALGGLAGAATLPGLSACAAPARGSRTSSDHAFLLGVASGFPTEQGMTLWTRLVTKPQRPDGGLPATPVAVRWQLARDAAMRHPILTGDAIARPDSLHAVHVDVVGLEPDRPYWYRFEALGQRSAIGRTRTLPSPTARLLGRRSGAPLRMAIASCQNIEHGYFAAWRHVVEDQPDLILHLGDYIYETTWGRDLVRPHGLPTARTLADYRQRYTLYRQDPDLQAAHATAPWFVVQDDHEVVNDYAGLTPVFPTDRADFAERRAAAWQAWYEHMPVPARLAPRGNHLPHPGRVQIGDLVTLFLLDTRQDRDAQACPPPGRGGGSHVVPDACAALSDPARTLLGRGQEAWLDNAFAASATRWNLIAQQTLVAPLWHPGAHGGPRTVRTDGWDGYPAARARLLQAMQSRRLANPVLLGGDLHAHYVADLLAGGRDEGPVVATEFVGTSISSQGASAGYYTRMRAMNPHLHHADGSRRGYLRASIQADRMTVETMDLDDVRRADSAISARSTWVVEAGRAGAIRA
jgi:alkaline phosphatase D